MHLPNHLKWFIRLTAVLLLAGSASATTPVAHWALDDGAGTTVRDSIGGHDGTAFGPAWVEGRRQAVPGANSVLSPAAR